MSATNNTTPAQEKFHARLVAQVLALNPDPTQPARFRRYLEGLSSAQLANKLADMKDDAKRRQTGWSQAFRGRLTV
jgi:DNA-directed RNA polymerase specialized sigma24 family protein